MPWTDQQGNPLSDEQAKAKGLPVSPVDNKPPIDTSTQVTEPNGQPAPVQQTAVPPPSSAPPGPVHVPGPTYVGQGASPLEALLHRAISSGALAGWGDKLLTSVLASKHGMSEDQAKALQGQYYGPGEAKLPAGTPQAAELMGAVASPVNELAAGSPMVTAAFHGMGHTNDPVEAAVNTAAGAIPGETGKGFSKLSDYLHSRNMGQLADKLMGRLVGRPAEAAERTSMYGEPGLFTSSVQRQGLDKIGAQRRMNAAGAQLEGPLAQQMETLESGRNVSGADLQRALQTKSPTVTSRLQEEAEDIGGLDRGQMPEIMGVKPGEPAYAKLSQAAGLGQPVAGEVPSGNVRALLTKARQYTSGLYGNPNATPRDIRSALGAKAAIKGVAEQGLSPADAAKYEQTLLDEAVAHEVQAGGAKQFNKPMSLFGGQLEKRAGGAVAGTPGSIAGMVASPFARTVLSAYKRRSGPALGTALPSIASTLQKVAPAAANAMHQAIDSGDPVRAAAEASKAQNSSATAREAVSPHEGE